LQRAKILYKTSRAEIQGYGARIATVIVDQKVQHWGVQGRYEIWETQAQLLPIRMQVRMQVKMAKLRKNCYRGKWCM
jgi:hypothetical protein